MCYSNNKTGLRKTLMRTFAIITLCSFSFTMIGADLARAIAAVEVPGIIAGIPGGEVYAREEFDPASSTVPLRFGEIKRRISGENGKTIIHIQDAHCNYSAQRSIANLMKYTNEAYGADLAFLEGGAGEYDLSMFTDIRDRQVREQVSDLFVKAGRVTGAEFFAINNPYKIELSGIENEELYFGNLNAYRSSLAFKEDADRYLKFLENGMSNLKRKIYTSALKVVDGKRMAYNGKKIEFKEYVTFLAK